jgi:hypothetical protein
MAFPSATAAAAIAKKMILPCSCQRAQLNPRCKKHTHTHTHTHSQKSENFLAYVLLKNSKYGQLFVFREILYIFIYIHIYVHIFEFLPCPRGLARLRGNP